MEEEQTQPVSFSAQEATERLIPRIVLIALILVITILFVNVGERKMEGQRQAQAQESPISTHTEN